MSLGSPIVVVAARTKYAAMIAKPEASSFKELLPGARSLAMRTTLGQRTTRQCRREDPTAFSSGAAAVCP